jgi:hypothetical protein
MPIELLTPAYLAWADRHCDAVLAEFNDPSDVAGRLARQIVDDLWPRLKGGLPGDAFEDAAAAAESFVVAIQEFVNETVGIIEIGNPIEEEEK